MSKPSVLNQTTRRVFFLWNSWLDGVRLAVVGGFLFALGQGLMQLIKATIDPIQVLPWKTLILLPILLVLFPILLSLLFRFLDGIDSSRRQTGADE